MNNKNIILKYFQLSNAGDIESIAGLLDEYVSYSSDNVWLHFGKWSVLSMKRTFFGGLRSQSWEIQKIETPSENIFRVEFLFTATTLEWQTISRLGIENIIVHNEKLRHIEVRNI